GAYRYGIAGDRTWDAEPDRPVAANRTGDWGGGRADRAGDRAHHDCTGLIGHGETRDPSVSSCRSASAAALAYLAARPALRRHADLGHAHGPAAWCPARSGVARGTARSGA